MFVKTTLFSSLEIALLMNVPGVILHYVLLISHKNAVSLTIVTSYIMLILYFLLLETLVILSVSK